MNPRARTLAFDFWPWLFPIPVVVHSGEEYCVGEGYPAYILRVRGVHLTTTRFFVAQTIGALLMTAAIPLARRYTFPHLMMVIMGSIVLVNGLTHTITSLSNGGYGPGVISSVLLWIPLGLISLVYYRRDVSTKRFLLGVTVGLAVNVLIFVITMRGARLM